MRYTLFFSLPTSHIRCSHIRCSLLPAPCSLLPKNLGALSVGELNSPRVAPQKFVPHQS
ncbi:hypothetical protein [Moorena sp. SIO3A2]|uniref:hypothetical protein n=1 Tax=Moorena sp. SIO3A2 TaxID=2607841 RepID=UPI0013B8424E|nr:hypothetical protein [Moorena sp. SIO3A2]NER89278.1 hypothetical protein [Moorena sp. SIO3A2]